jgi:hypothetical protein
MIVSAVTVAEDTVTFSSSFCLKSRRPPSGPAETAYRAERILRRTH